ncbi:MAG TPA: DUF427 domain-containing protein [Acidimicrobiales bacterium]|nr:DUF427 domain-containing protein [Acidimicrobiales bacterium]
MERSGFEKRPDYRVDILARRNRVTASVDDQVLADSARCLVVDEQDHGLVFYFPPSDVRLELLSPDDRTSYCPYKGTATYRRYRGAAVEVLAWCYEEPYPEVARLAGHLAFFQDVVLLRVGGADPAVSVR